jgi:hypothetical protein
LAIVGVLQSNAHVTGLQIVDLARAADPRAATSLVTYGLGSCTLADVGGIIRR